jgi:tetratricopeptide (TPR) repeat protein
MTRGIGLLSLGLLLGGCGPVSPRALADPQQSAALARRQSELFMRQARAAAGNADYTRAEQYLNLAAQSGWSEAEVTPLLIDVCVKDQRYRAALQYAQEHLRHHPRAHRLRFVEATLLSALGDVARAREALEKVLAVSPAHADAHYSLAILLRDELGNRLDADRHFRSYLELLPRGSHAEEARQSLLEAMP